MLRPIRALALAPHKFYGEPTMSVAAAFEAVSRHWDKHLGLLMITYSGDQFTVEDVMQKYELETWDSYYQRSVDARKHGLIEQSPHLDI